MVYRSTLWFTARSYGLSLRLMVYRFALWFTASLGYNAFFYYIE